MTNVPFDRGEALCYSQGSMSHLRMIIIAAVIGVLAAFIVVAYAGARNRGLHTHCTNNLRFLGERTVEVIREARLNPYKAEYAKIASGEARGRQFWLAVHEVKLRNKGRDLSPYQCPFRRDVGPLLPDHALSVDLIDYRGPNGNASGYETLTPVACDRADNHPDGSINVLLVQVSVKRPKRRTEQEIEDVNPTFQIKAAKRDDELWQSCQDKTTD